MFSLELRYVRMYVDAVVKVQTMRRVKQCVKQECRIVGSVQARIINLSKPMVHNSFG